MQEERKEEARKKATDKEQRKGRRTDQQKNERKEEIARLSVAPLPCPAERAGGGRKYSNVTSSSSSRAAYQYDDVTHRSHLLDV